MNRGINPFPEGASYKEYTLPAVSIRSPAGENCVHMMDSNPIAETLEKLWPEPALHVADSTTADTQAKMDQLQYSSFPAFMPKIPNILNASSAEYYHRERAALFGMSLIDIENAKGAQA